MLIQEQKKKLREKIWKLLEEKGVARFPLPLKDRIPNFERSDKAAELVTTLPEWKKAKIIVANPDFAQQKVRELALKQGKILIMATPRLREGYLEINLKDVKGKEAQASTIAGAFKYGKKLKELLKPDLIVTGCVAVDKEGWRLGKGGGYGDIEIKTFQEKFGKPSRRISAGFSERKPNFAKQAEISLPGKISVITTVHDLQIVENVPHNEFDTKVDYIVTPNKIIKCLKLRKLK